MELTLCLIVKNEELKLPECLLSLRGLYKKLVIVDTGSTDKTKKIAKHFGAEVFDFKWQKDFSAARNFALSKIKTPWVMMVDADDRMESATLKKLKKSLQKIPKNVNGIFLPYLYSAVQQDNGIMAYLPRIWRTSKRYLYTLPVHEYLDIPRQDLASFLRLPLSIVHHKNSVNFQKSFQRNLEILKNAYKQKSPHRRIIFYLGHDHQYAGNYAEAIQWYKKYARLKDKHRDELHKVYLGQAICHLKLQENSQAKKSFKKAINVSPEFIEPYLHLGEMAMKEHHYERAAQLYFAAMQCKPPHTHVFVNTNLYHGFAQKNLTKALQALEKK